MFDIQILAIVPRVSQQNKARRVLQLRWDIRSDPRGVVRLAHHPLVSSRRTRNRRVENKKLIGSHAILEVRNAIIEVVRCRNGCGENGKGESHSERGENFRKHYMRDKGVIERWLSEKER